MTIGGTKKFKNFGTCLHERQNTVPTWASKCSFDTNLVANLFTHYLTPVCTMKEKLTISNVISTQHVRSPKYFFCLAKPVFDLFALLFAKSKTWCTASVADLPWPRITVSLDYPCQPHFPYLPSSYLASCSVRKSPTSIVAKLRTALHALCKCVAPLYMECSCTGHDHHSTMRIVLRVKSPKNRNAWYISLPSFSSVKNRAAFGVITCTWLPCCANRHVRPCVWASNPQHSSLPAKAPWHAYSGGSPCKFFKVSVLHHSTPKK